MDTRENHILLAVVFTDIEGFSALTQKDEAKALDYVRRYRQVITDFTVTYRGEVVHFYGDGSLTIHKSTYDAVQCAIKVQEALAEDPQVPVRIGIHLGEVVFSEDTIYGNAVNIASRIQSLGSASSVLISGSVAREIENHLDIKTTYIGPEYVKNIKEPVDIYAIRSGDLIIPTRKEIQDRNKNRRKTPYVILFLIVIALIASLLNNTVKQFLPWGNDILDSRILVLPFINETGDSTIDEFSIQAAISITSLMEDVEQIKLVAMQNTWGTEGFKSFGVMPFPDLTRTTNADNFILGKYAYQDDTTIVINANFYNGKSGGLIAKFPAQVVNKNNITPGLVKLAQRIIGYLLSAEYSPLSPPNQDAFYAYNEARRVWGQNDYKDSRRYLLRAIEYDSTFIDAYFLLSDAFYNISEFNQADSVFREIKNRFKTEKQSPRKKNEIYFYNAVHAGDYRSAHGYLMNAYKGDKSELFTNTSAANFSLFFVNDPKLAIRILKKIPFDNIEYEFADNRRRLTTGVLAYCALRQYKRAINLAALYPSNQMTLRHHKMKIKAFAGITDTASIHTELAYIKLNFDTNSYIEALYWTKQQFALLEHSGLAEYYLYKSYQSIVEFNPKSDVKSNVLYDIGQVREGLDHALFLYDFAPYYAPYATLVGRGYAMLGDIDSTHYYLNMIRDPSILEYSLGESNYQEAILFTAIGDHQSALIRLRSAVDDGLIFYEFNTEFDPYLMPLFDMKEFQKIIHPLDD